MTSRSPSASASASPDAVLHLAALHTLAATGFASTSSAASLTLSGALSRYLKLVANACVERASLAGRSKVAAVDVVDALDHLGVRVGELAEWAEDRQEVSFGKDGLGGLGEYIHDGLSVEDGIAQMRLVPEGELETDFESEQEMNEPMEQDEDEDEDEHQDERGMVERKPKVEVERSDPAHDEADIKPFIVRHNSPNLSWLPPLPNQKTTSSITTAPTTTTQPVPPEELTPSAPAVALPEAQSIADRYRRPIPYSSSQLSQAHPFHDPPKPPLGPLPPAPSSLPNLISTYSAIASDPSIALRQVDVRRQASELLRHSIAPVDSFTPAPTLTSPIPPVRATPIIPSHSDSQPPKPIPVNPRPNGLLSSLVYQIQSPHLPPALRERLTSLRPPVALKRDEVPIFYGESVRGPDDASLAKAKGKHAEEGTEEIYLRQTWDSGPRGMDKWSRGQLPKGKKVICSKEGEATPREEEGKRQEREKQMEREREDQQQQQQQQSKVKLRLPNFGQIDSAQPSSLSPTTTFQQSPQPVQTPGGGIRLKLGGAKPVSPNPEVAPNGV